MSLAIASPKLVRILDPNSNPIDVRVDEFSFCLAKYLCEQEAQNESAQQENEIFPSEYYSSAGCIPDAHEENLEYQCVPDVIQHEPLQNCLFQLDEDTLAMSPVNYNPNTVYVMQSPHMALFQQDTAMCVHANLLPSNCYCMKSLPFHPQTTHLYEPQHWTVPQIPETSYEIYPESLTFNQPAESYDPHPYFPDTPFLPVGIQEEDDFQGFPLNSENDSMPENFMMYTAENGSFFIENKLSEISAFADNNLTNWGFSHPMGHVLKNKRGLFGCFTLHSGKACYVKFTPYSIKFSSNQRGVAYVIDEAGVRTCWESFKSFEELISERDHKWEKIDRHQVIMQRPCGCASSCSHHMSSKELWNSKSEENICIERNGLRFYSETSELKSLNLNLETYQLSSTLKHVGEQDGHIYVKSCQYRFNQIVHFNGKSLQVKFHTQTARLDINGKLSLSDH
ncbi:hypothetical protein DAPPUDRAFT_332445 [Daphnia pulex]|uniref:Uncharacterized protein n=1 Tax=Daphnia pulex TaxID=6669 RepID=E9HPZ5_DAPPU|nr:hypothetical protein DAPPUDRAFT_332445 [Daphnia pulex]|eukprot:EFX66185.1 hypothetical protein DAPPUDRAFT_332445 [Daphnia pulex]